MTLEIHKFKRSACLLYTSDAADEYSTVSNAQLKPHHKKKKKKKKKKK